MSAWYAMHAKETSMGCKKSSPLLFIPLLLMLGFQIAQARPLGPVHYPGQTNDPDKPQKCIPESIPPTTPTEQFIDHKDGTVTDKATGLMWMRCSLGLRWNGKTCVGVILRTSGQKALKAAEKLNKEGGFAGHRDWRIPNLKELSSIVERACVQPAINLEIFPRTDYWYYWSSTPAIQGFDGDVREIGIQLMWGTDFFSGNDNPGRVGNRRTRLVRDKQQ